MRQWQARFLKLPTRPTFDGFGPSAWQ